MVRCQRRSFFDGVTLKTASFGPQKFPTHFHEGFSVGVVTRGVEALDVNDERLLLVPETLLVLRPGELHAHCSGSQRGWEYRCLYVSPDAVRAVGRTSRARARRALADVSLARQLLGLFEADVPEATFRRLLEQLAGRGLFAEVSSRMPCTALNEAAAFIRDRAEEPLRLDDIAMQFSYRPRAFARAFANVYGLTPHAFQLVHRLNRALELLIAGMPVADTAAECGFYDQSHLNRFFRRFFGVAPSCLLSNGAVTNRTSAAR
jgi:AraC-like DNA-binding protein